MTENGDDPTFQVNSTAHPKMMWMPEKDRIHDSLLYQFMVDLSEKKNTLYHDYNQLHHWTIEHSEEFWDMLWDFCDVRGEKNRPITQCPANSQLPAKETQWFPHASLNFAENLLKNWNLHAAADAIIFHCEGAPERRQHLSWQQLYRQTSQVATFMAENGVKQGDVVAAYIPNIPQAIVAMLATASLGAIWTSTSPDFGVESVVERFGQTKPKLLICADGYFYNGKAHNSLDKVSAMLEKLPSVKQLLIIPYTEGRKTESDSTTEKRERTLSQPSGSRASGQQSVQSAW